MKKLVLIQIKIAVWLLIAGGFFAYFIYYQVFRDLDNSTTNKQKIISEEIFYSQLNGLKVDKANKDLLPVAVMIDNHLEARPPAGIFQAKIVYEILTEATITRFLAIYDLSENLEKIGPVRSARPYFLDLVQEYGALYAHSGGSPAALERLKNDDLILNLDEFFGYNSGYFWRDSQRTAPHNLYTSSSLLAEAKNNYQFKSQDNFTTWKFKDGLFSQTAIQEIKINYSETLSHQVIWKYLKNSNKYERWQANKRHLDDQGNIIETDNVVIQYAQAKILDEIGRQDIDLIGQGQVLVFRDGLTIKGQWQKDSVLARTVFYDESGQEIEFNRGQIWLEVVPQEMVISY